MSRSSVNVGSKTRSQGQRKGKPSEQVTFFFNKEETKRVFAWMMSLVKFDMDHVGSKTRSRVISMECQVKSKDHILNGRHKSHS